MNRKTLLRVASPLLALTLVAGACGSDETDSAGGQTSTSSRRTA